MYISDRLQNEISVLEDQDDISWKSQIAVLGHQDQLADKTRFFKLKKVFICSRLWMVVKTRLNLVNFTFHSHPL